MITRFEDLKVLAQWDFPTMIRPDDKTSPTAYVISSLENFRLSHRVKQLAHELSLDVAKFMKSFPKDEKYDLVSQMRRSARSIPSDISEGFGRFHFTLWNISKFEAEHMISAPNFYEGCGYDSIVYSTGLMTSSLFTNVHVRL
jgi:hypothetical protein